MGVSTSAGTTIFIGTTASNGLTDSYIEIGQITSIPEFGRVYAEVKFNPLKTRGTLKFKGSYDDGNIAVLLGKDVGDAGQAAALIARDVDADYNFKIVANDAVPVVSVGGVSVSAASPGVFTDTAHAMLANTPVSFVPVSVGVLPGGIVSGTTYYVSATGLSTNAYSVSATPGGSPIATTGSPTGTLTRTTVPVGTTQMLKAKVMSYTTKYETLDMITMTTMSLGIKSGSLSEVTKIPAA
jgi:hypothetical protein